MQTHSPTALLSAKLVKASSLASTGPRRGAVAGLWLACPPPPAIRAPSQFPYLSTSEILDCGAPFFPCIE